MSGISYDYEESRKNRLDGSSSSFDLNSGIVLDPNGKPAGSRILTPTSDRLRNEEYSSRC